jgi:hypothetical protein
VISLPGFSVSALYYPCESYAGSWKVTDAHSGVLGQGLAAVDGEFLAKGATVAMSALGLGTHLISVSAWDSAGNWAQKNQQFDVGTETGTVVGSPTIVGGVQPVANKSFLLAGTLAPRHKLGQKPIELRLYRLLRGKYVYQTSAWAQINSRHKYIKAIRLAAPGTYRVVAMHRWPARASSTLQFKVIRAS